MDTTYLVESSQQLHGTWWDRCRCNDMMTEMKQNYHNSSLLVYGEKHSMPPFHLSAARSGSNDHLIGDSTIRFIECTLLVVRRF